MCHLHNERGNGCPDIFLLEPLANELDITVLELLRGEYTENDRQVDEKNINLLLKDLLQTFHERSIKKNIYLFIISLIIIVSIFTFYMIRRFDGIQETFFANDYHNILEIFYPIPLQTTTETLIGWIFDPSAIDIIDSLKNIMINIVISILIGLCLLTFIQNKKKYIIITIIVSLILELGKWLLRLGIFDTDDIIVRTIIGLLIFNVYKKYQLRIEKNLG